MHPLDVILGGEVVAVADTGLSFAFCRPPQAFIQSVPYEPLEDLVCVFGWDLGKATDKEEAVRHLVAFYGLYVPSP